MQVILLLNVFMSMNIVIETHALAKDHTRKCIHPYSAKLPALFAKLSSQDPTFCKVLCSNHKKTLVRLEEGKTVINQISRSLKLLLQLSRSFYLLRVDISSSRTRDAMKKVDGKWIKIQKRTFTNWVNDCLRGHLIRPTSPVTDLSTDFQDGLRLIDLMEKLARPKNPIKHNSKPKMKAHSLENLNSALNFIHQEGITLVNIGKLFS